MEWMCALSPAWRVQVGLVCVLVWRVCPCRHWMRAVVLLAAPCVWKRPLSASASVSRASQSRPLPLPPPRSPPRRQRPGPRPARHRRPHRPPLRRLVVLCRPLPFHCLPALPCTRPPSPAALSSSTVAPSSARRLAARPSSHSHSVWPAHCAAREHCGAARQSCCTSRKQLGNRCHRRQWRRRRAETRRGGAVGRVIGCREGTDVVWPALRRANLLA